MAYSPRLWLMAIGWWNKINQCRKLKFNLTQSWGVCMSLDSGMHWYQWLLWWQVKKGINLTSLDLLETNSLPQTCPSPRCLAWAVASFSRGEGGDVKHTLAHVCNPCFSWYHDSSWHRAETRIIPKWLFPPRFSDKNRFTYSRPDAVQVASSPQKQKAKD